MAVSSEVKLQSGTLAHSGMLGEDKADGSYPAAAAWDTVSSLPTHTPSPHPVVSRHTSVGAILCDQNEAGADNLV